MSGSYGIVIDELRICYTAKEDVLKSFKNVEVGNYIDIDLYRFYRITNDRYKFFFHIVEDGEPVAQMKFDMYTETADTHFVFFKIENRILYDREWLQDVLTIPESLGMTLNNYTAVDLACDSSINISSFIKRMMRDKSVTTIINRKAVKDRKDDLEGVFFEYSTSLDRLKHPTITVQQKKAINNKSEGITVQAYDKRAEILNHSHKDYILNNYGNPKKLYRLEVRLHYQELKDYFSIVKSVPAPVDILNQEFLNNMFFYHLYTVIRFSRGRHKINWTDILKMQWQGIY